MQDTQHWVDWFRSSAPYINTHRGCTFVIQFGGEAVVDANFASLVHDIALLDSLGVNLVLVHGARPQIEQRLRAGGVSTTFKDDLRVTDEASLDLVKEAVGRVRLEIESLLSMGLANSPMAGARLRTASGNFVVARPKGVRDGVDYDHTGEVRRVDSDAIGRHLGNNDIVLISPLGYSPTGEIFNLSAEEVATAVAIELHAAKLLLLGEGVRLTDSAGKLLRQLSLAEAKAWYARTRGSTPTDAMAQARHQLATAIHACRNGVRRAHVLDRHVDGALVLELFTRDGIGTMVSADLYENTRPATIDDVGGILELIEPLELDGTLVRRSREKLETEIGRFMVMERDGTAVACAAMYPFKDSAAVELACLALHKDYRNQGRGKVLLEAVERQARSQGINQIFVLTTRATHWFIECGFHNAVVDELPIERQALYNYQRNSKVLVKRLD